MGYLRREACVAFTDITNGSDAVVPVAISLLSELLDNSVMREEKRKRVIKMVQNKLHEQKQKQKQR